MLMDQLKAAKLTDREIRCLSMWSFDGMTHGEIADQLGVSRVAVTHSIAAAQKKLAKAGLPPARRVRIKERPTVVSATTPDEWEHLEQTQGIAAQF